MAAQTGNLSAGDRAIIAALELVRAAIQGPGSAAAVASGAANTQRFAPSGTSAVAAFDRPSPVIVLGPNPLPVTGGTGGKAPAPKPNAGSGALAQVFGAVAGKFAAVAGPLAILGAVVSASTSGFQVLGTAVKVLAATIAPVLLPVTVLLATALTAISDVVMATLMPGLEGFFSIVMGAGLPAIVALVSLMSDLGEAIAKIVAWVQRNIPSAGGGKGGVLGALDRLTGGNGPESDGSALGRIKSFHRTLDDVATVGFGGLLTPAVTAKNWLTKQAGNLTGYDLDPYSGKGVAAPETDTKPEKIVNSALRDVLTSLKQSAGPKASISSLGDIGRQVQLAALNQDPLEARMLRVQEQIYRLLEKSAGEASSGPPPSRVYDPSAAAAGGMRPPAPGRDGRP